MPTSINNYVKCVLSYSCAVSRIGLSAEESKYVAKIQHAICREIGVSY